MIAIDFWGSKDGKAIDVSLQRRKKDVLVYIERRRMVDGNPQKAYIHRMNMGIQDAVDGAGLPFAYVQKLMRPHTRTLEERSRRIGKEAGLEF